MTPQTDYKMGYNYNSTERAWEGILFCLLNQHEREGCANQVMHASQGVFVMRQALQQDVCAAMAENRALQMEMWGKLNPSNRGGGDGKLQMHSLMPDATEVDVSTTDLAGMIIGRGKEHMELGLSSTCLHGYDSRAAVRTWE
jgi:hypothetical protein